MVEFALIAPLLIFLVLGAFELSVALRTTNGVESASAAGARVASQLGDEPLTDYYALDAVRAAVAGLKGFTVTDVIIFAASDATLTDPPANCLGPARDQVDVCNHYTALDLASLSQFSFGQGGSGNSCAANDLSRFFCPGEDRETDQGANLTYVGVWVQGQRQTVSGLLPNVDQTVSAATVMRVEPR